MLSIRPYRAEDTAPIVALFYATVHAVKPGEYTASQLAAWAAEEDRAARTVAWRQSLRENMTLVAEHGSLLVWFADLARSGYLDRLYVHKDFQRQGIASSLLAQLEVTARAIGLPAVETDASLTAWPFFERHGYALIRQQGVERRGLWLPNLRLAKQLTPGE